MDDQIKDKINGNSQLIKGHTNQVAFINSKISKVALSAGDNEQLDALTLLTKKKIRTFEEAFTQLMQATGIADLELLVKKFI